MNPCCITGQAFIIVAGWINVTHWSLCRIPALFTLVNKRKGKKNYILILSNAIKFQTYPWKKFMWCTQRVYITYRERQKHIQSKWVFFFFFFLGGGGGGGAVKHIHVPTVLFILHWTRKLIREAAQNLLNQDNSVELSTLAEITDNAIRMAMT